MNQPNLKEVIENPEELIFHLMYRFNLKRQDFRVEYDVEDTGIDGRKKVYNMVISFPNGRDGKDFKAYFITDKK
jgi:hypothetical protein